MLLIDGFGLAALSSLRLYQLLYISFSVPRVPLRIRPDLLVKAASISHAFSLNSPVFLFNALPTSLR